jgi:hypothetical protein
LIDTTGRPSAGNVTLVIVAVMPACARSSAVITA